MRAVYGSGYEINMYNCNSNRQGYKVSEARAKYQHKSIDDNCASDAQNKKLDIWEEICKRFISSIGRDGQAIDNAWLSKLDHKIDQQNKIIHLSSVKSLVVQWVSERYLHFIESASRALNFQVEAHMAGSLVE